MSINAINRAYTVTAGGPRNKAVLQALADCVNEKDADKCWPRISVLAAKTELKERAIQMALADLEKRGLITRQAQFLDGTKYRRSNLITLHLDTVQQDGAADAPHGAGDAPYGAADAPSMVQEMHPHGAGDAPHIEPEDNQKVEPEKNQAIEFDEQFWPLYPNKVDRKAAFKSYMKARQRGIPFDDIMNGLKRYVGAHPADYGYWKGPAAWLNGERWNDQPAAHQNGQQSSRGNAVDAADQLEAAIADGFKFPPRPDGFQPDVGRAASARKPDAVLEGLRNHYNRLFPDNGTDVRQEAA